MECLAVADAKTSRVATIPPRTDSESFPGVNPKGARVGGLAGLLLGKAGLSRTYWVYGVLAGVLWAIALGAIAKEFGSPVSDVLTIAFFVYLVVAYIAIWNAATRYEGPAVWRVLAKFVVLGTTIPVVVKVVAIALAN